jgi:hypothetical protein
MLNLRNSVIFPILCDYLLFVGKNCRRSIESNEIRVTQLYYGISENQKRLILIRYIYKRFFIADIRAYVLVHAQTT